jgi:hypothetical protein
MSDTDPTTTQGAIRKQITKDGRENVDNWAKRAIGLKKPTKTKLKRAKQAEDDIKEAINNPFPDKK